MLTSWDLLRGGWRNPWQLRSQRIHQVCSCLSRCGPRQPAVPKPLCSQQMAAGTRAEAPWAAQVSASVLLPPVLGTLSRPGPPRTMCAQPSGPKGVGRVLQFTVLPSGPRQVATSSVLLPLPALPMGPTLTLGRPVAVLGVHLRPWGTREEQDGSFSCLPQPRLHPAGPAPPPPHCLPHRSDSSAIPS